MMTYAALGALLARSGALADGSQYHGVLCGLCCGSPALAPRAVLEQALDAVDVELPAPEASLEALQALHAETEAALVEAESAFELLLPDEEAPLGLRAEALAHWCDGFLYGLGLGSSAAVSALSGDARDVLRYFSDISRAAAGPGATEDDENAYAELVEFVRVGTQVLFEELRLRPRVH